MPALPRVSAAGAGSVPPSEEAPGAERLLETPPSTAGCSALLPAPFPREVWELQGCRPEAALTGSPPPPPPTLPRRGGRDVCWTPGGDAALETRRANKYPHPAPPDPLLLASPAWRLRLMLRKWRGCFSSVKDFSRDKRRSPAGRKSHGSKREFYPAHGDGMGPGIVVLAKVKWVPKVKPGAPAEGGSRNTSQAAQPSPSTRAGASRDARHPRELKPEEERSPVPALRRISPRTQNSLETR